MNEEDLKKIIEEKDKKIELLEQRIAALTRQQSKQQDDTRKNWYNRQDYLEYPDDER